MSFPPPGSPKARKVLQRKTPLARSPMLRGKGSRTKGGSGEREIVALCQEIGFTGARRNFQSGGQGGGDIIGVPNVHLEIKRRETVEIWKWIGQAEGDCRPTDIALVGFRRSRSKWYGVMDLAELLELVHELQELRSAL